MKDFEGRDELVRELRARSEAVGGHPISMDGVRRRARRIVWRRRAVTGAVAAAVLAVAVPAGMAATGGVNRGVGPVGPASPSVTTGPSPSSSPAPSPSPKSSPSPPTSSPLPDGVTPLTTVGAEQGAPPAIPYLSGRTLHQDGATVQLPGFYTTITPYHGGWLAIGSRSDVVQLRADPSGQVSEVGAAQISQPYLAVDNAGLVAWFESKDLGHQTGRLVRAIATGMSNGEATVPLPVGDTPHVIGFIRDGLVYNDLYGHDAEPKVLVTTFQPGQAPRQLPDAFNAGGASEALNRITVQLASPKDGSCWAVVDPAGNQDWKTCHYRLGKFSADGTYVVGEYDYGTYGPRGIAILDESTGRPVARFQVPTGSDTFVAEVAWEDDSHLLAVVPQNGGWRIVRLDTNGHVEAATPVAPDVNTPDGPLRPYFLSATP